MIRKLFLLQLFACTVRPLQGPQLGQNIWVWAFCPFWSTLNFSGRFYIFDSRSYPLISWFFCWVCCSRLFYWVCRCWWPVIFDPFSFNQLVICLCETIHKTRVERPEKFSKLSKNKPSEHVTLLANQFQVVICSSFYMLLVFMIFLVVILFFVQESNFVML